MKVCFFSHGSGTNQDGATLSMLNVMAELANRDHEVIGIIHRKGIQYIHDAMTGDIHMSV